MGDRSDSRTGDDTSFSLPLSFSRNYTRKYPTSARNSLTERSIARFHPYNSRIAGWISLFLLNITGITAVRSASALVCSFNVFALS